MTDTNASTRAVLSPRRCACHADRDLPLNGGQLKAGFAAAPTRSRAGPRLSSVLLTSLCLLLGAGLAQARETIVAISFNGTVYQIDPVTGGVLTIGSGTALMNSMAKDSAGTLWAAGLHSSLIQVDPNDGHSTVIANLPADIRGLAFSPSGVLYGLRYGTPGVLVTINTSTGAVTTVGSTGLSLIQGLEFSPGGTLYAADLGKGIVTLNPATGAWTDANGPSGQTIAFAPDGTLYVSAGYNLVTVDLATGATTTIVSGGLSDVRGMAYVSVTDIQPTANAGPDQSVQQTTDYGATVTLDGSASQHANSYLWSLPNGAVIAGPTSQPTVSASVPLGTTAVTLTVRNGYLTATDTVNLTVTPVFIQPTADAGPDQTVEQTAPAGATVTLDGSGSQDALAYVWTLPSGAVIAGPTSQPTVSATVPVGVNEVTLTTRHFSLTATDTVTITVTEYPNLPVADAGPDQTVQATGPTGAQVTVDATASLNAVTYRWLYRRSRFSTPVLTLQLPLGQTILGLAVTNGNFTSTDSVTIHVVSDSTPPTLTVPDDVTAEQTVADGTPVTLGEATATDNLDPNPTITNDAPAVFPLGTTEVTWTATDSASNAASAVQKVTVVDTTAPTVTAPAAVTVEQSAADGTPVHIGQATATDICDANPTITNDAPAVFPLGTTTVTWTATDASGNPATARQSVTVEDTTAPTLTVPDDVVVEQSDHNGTEVPLHGATATDICDANPVVTTDSHSLFPLGTTTVTWTATDASGNRSTGTQQVSVIDTTPPVLTAPHDVTVEQTNLDGTPANLGAPTVSDICDATPVVTNDAPEVFPLGTTTVTWTATDAAGNVATDTQTVTVVDTTPPELTRPEPVSVEQTAADGTPVGLHPPLASDICDANPVVTSDAPAVFPMGDTTVTWTATDAAGNQATVAQTVTVVDTTAPTVTAPEAVSVEQTNHDGTPTPLGTATVSDICDAAPVVTNDAPAVFPLGDTTVTWTATDASGNAGTATQTVTVEDTTAPEIGLTTQRTTLWEPNHKMVDVGLQLGVTDVCDAAPQVALTVTQDEALGECKHHLTQSDAELVRNQLGQVTGLRLRAERDGHGDGRVYLIEVTATDASGNVSHSVVAVTVSKSESRKNRAKVEAQAAAAVASGSPLAYNSLAGQSCRSCDEDHGKGDDDHGQDDDDHGQDDGGQGRH